MRAKKEPTVVIVCSRLRDVKTGKIVRLRVPKSRLKELRAIGAAARRAGRNLRRALTASALD